MTTEGVIGQLGDPPRPIKRVWKVIVKCVETIERDGRDYTKRVREEGAEETYGYDPARVIAEDENQVYAAILGAIPNFMKV